MKILKLTAADITKTAMPVPMTPAIRDHMHQDNIAYNPDGLNEIPGLGKTRMRSLSPGISPSIPRVSPFQDQDLVTINGRPYIILEVEESKQYRNQADARRYLKSRPADVLSTITETGFYPGRVKAINARNGAVEYFTYAEVEGAIREFAERQGRESLQEYNRGATAYNERIRRIGPATKDLSVLPLQLASMEEAIQDRVTELDGMIESFRARGSAPTPASIQEHETMVDQRIEAGDLDPVDFMDSLWHRYAYRYDELLQSLQESRIRMPSSVENPEAFRQTLITLTDAAYAEHRMEQLVREYRSYATPGVNPMQHLADDLENNRISLPQGLSQESRAAMLAEAREKSQKWKPRTPFNIREKEILGELPTAQLEDFPSQKAISGYPNWSVYKTSARAAVFNMRRDRDEIQQIADGIRRIRGTIGNLPEGSRGNYLGTVPGQRILDQIEDLANNHLARFMERYDADTIDESGHLNRKKLFGRGGSIGNSFVAIIMSRLYKILSTTLNQFRPEGQGGQQAAQTPVAPPVNPPVQAANKLKVTRAMWEKIGLKAGWLAKPIETCAACENASAQLKTAQAAQPSGANNGLVDDKTANTVASFVKLAKQKMSIGMSAEAAIEEVKTIVGEEHGMSKNEWMDLWERVAKQI